MRESSLGMKAWSQKAAALMIAGALAVSMVPATALAVTVADNGNSQTTDKLLASTANDAAGKTVMWADGAWVTDPAKVTNGVYQWKTTIKGDGAHYGHYDALITFTVKNKVLTAVDLTSQGTTFGGKWGTITPKSTNITGYLPKGVSVKAVQNAANGATVSVGLAGTAPYGGATVTGITLCTVQDDGTLKTEIQKVLDPTDGDYDDKEVVVGYDVASSLQAAGSSSSQGGQGGGGRSLTVMARPGAGSTASLATSDSAVTDVVNWKHDTQSFTLSEKAAAEYNMAKVTYRIGDYFVFDQYIALDGANGKGAAYDVAATDLNVDPTGIGAKNRDVYTGAAYAVMLQRHLMAWQEATTGGTKVDLDTVSAATKSSDSLKEALYALDGYVYPAANHDNPQDYLKAAPWGKLFTSVADDLTVTLDKGKASASTVWDTTTVTKNANGDYVLSCKLSDALPVSSLKGYSKTAKLNSEELWRLGSSSEEPVAGFTTKNTADHGICGELGNDEVTGDAISWNSATKTATIKKDSGINYVVVGYGVGKLAENGICGIAYSLDDLVAAGEATSAIKALNVADKAAVAKASAAYKALSLDARTFVGRSEVAKLNSATAAPVAQTLKMSNATKSYAASLMSKGVLKKAQTFTVKATGAKTGVTYTCSGTKYASINKTSGKVTLKKGTPMGAYTIKVTATAKAGTASGTSYAKGTATATVKVTVGAPTTKLSASSKSLKASTLKKAAQTFTLTATTTAGKVTSVKNVSTNKTAKKFTVKKSGTKKITVKVPKGTKKGTYSVQIQVKTPKVTKKCVAATTTKTVKVVVK